MEHDVIDLVDIVAELEPSLHVMEAALTDLETEMSITKTCLCTIRCGGIKDLKSL